MIAEFNVENYCSIRSRQTLSFVPSADSSLEDLYMVEVKPGVRLLKMGVLYGSNASGKTKVLQALSFFAQWLTMVPTDKSKPIDVIPFLLDKESRNHPTTMQMEFYLEQERYILTVRMTQNRVLEEKLVVYPSVQPALLYERTYNEQTDSSEIRFGKILNLGSKSQDTITGRTLNNCSVIAAFAQSNVEGSRLNIVYKWLTNCFPKMISPDFSIRDYLHQSLELGNAALKPFVLNLLKASDFNITDFHIPQGDSTIVFQHHSSSFDGELPEQMESEGTMRFMAMAALEKALVCDKVCLNIDEIETSLHYELLTYFLRIFLANSTNGSQLLFATHDINLLDEDFIRRDVVWFTDKNMDGETRLLRLSGMGLHKNLSPYHAYRQGKLVPLPFLGSAYLNLEEDR